MSGGKVVAWMLEYVEDGEVEREYNGHDQFSCGRTGGQPLVLQSDLAAAIARAEAAEAALAQYADPTNWGSDGDRQRIWIEPDSHTPDAYNGYELARAAIAAQQAEGEDRG